MGSVAVADVPDSPLSTVHVLVMHGEAGGTLLALLLYALHRDPCQHGVGCVDAVAVESDFFHAVSLQGQGWKSVEQRQCLRCHSVDALVSIDPHPCDGVACGETPDHHIFGRALGDLIGVGDADAVVCPMLIELAPGGGLDGETWCVVHDPIIGTGWERSRSLV